MAFDLMRAVYILQLQGATTDAAWLQGIISSRCGPVWGNQANILTQLSKDLKLQPLRDSSKHETPRWQDDTALNPKAKSGLYYRWPGPT